MSKDFGGSINIAPAGILINENNTSLVSFKRAYSSQTDGKKDENYKIERKLKRWMWF